MSGLKSHLDGVDQSFLYQNEKSVFRGKDLDDILLHTTQLQASDVTIQTNVHIIAEINGKLVPITTHRLNYNEVQEMLSHITKSDGSFSRIVSGQAWDVAYQLNKDRETRLRFRVNATGVLSEGEIGIQITLRTIPNLPPKLSEMNLPSEILKNKAPKQGLVLVTGSTGSGKSTLLASIIRDLLEERESNRKIITYEQPIEFVYDNVECHSASISQTQIPEMLPNFPEAVRNALRRKPSVILIGEMRDKETISEGVTASMTGHLVYSTLHSNGVAETVVRMINAFPKEEQFARGADIISSLRVVISQMLLPSTDGGRVAIREFLVMNEKIEREMLSNIENLPVTTRRLLKKYGKTFLEDAKEKYDKKKIAKREFEYIEALSRGVDVDLMSA